MRKLGIISLLLPILGLLSVAAPDSPQPIVIKISDCELAKTPLATRPAKEVLREATGEGLEAFSPVADEAWVTKGTAIQHPFLAASHLAFAEHRPLALSPDMIWELLIQQASKEVNQSPGKYRELFATHERGKQALSVRRDDFTLGNPGNDWPGVFADLEKQILKKVPDSPARDFAHAFSTSAPTDIAARQVLVLNAASKFYDYYVRTMCGIPKIELHGTADDWRWLRAKSPDLKRFNMERRVKALQPVLDEFVAAAEGKANPAFWQSFYKYGMESGGSHVSGWINLFFISEGDEKLDMVLNPKFSWINPAGKMKSELALALRTDHYESSGVVDVDFMWDYLNKSYPMLIRAGFMGVAQDPKSLTLTPVTAWRVTHIKLSPEERRAVDYLGQLENCPAYFIEDIAGDFVFDPSTGSIKIVKGKGFGTNNSGFWRKALPLMHRLKRFDASYIIDTRYKPEKSQAICEALLSAKSVTEVIVPEAISPECLEILNTRKDWVLRKKQ